jgi:hypothetical protein
MLHRIFISLTIFSTISYISLVMYLSRLGEADDKLSRAKAFHAYMCSGGLAIVATKKNNYLIQIRVGSRNSK